MIALPGGLHSVRMDKIRVCPGLLDNEICLITVPFYN